MNKYIVLFALIVIQGCSSGGGGETAPPVNLLGVWNYQFTFQNSICSGLFPKGTVTVESLNGDTTKIGNILLEGTTIDLDSFGNCSIAVLNNLDSTWSGRPAEQTISEYRAFIVTDSLGDNTIKSDVVDSFTATKIQETITYTNGVIEIDVLTR